MRLYTALSADHQPMVTVNAGSELEARRVLAALIGDGELRVRRATQTEIEAWMGSATKPREQLRRAHKKAPAPVKDAGVSSTEVMARSIDNRHHSRDGFLADR